MTNERRTFALSYALGLALVGAFGACLVVDVPATFGRECTQDEDCTPPELCRQPAQSFICVPPNYIGFQDAGTPIEDGGAVDGGPQGPVPCTTVDDCEDGQGCVLSSQGFICKDPDGTGTRIEFGQLQSHPHVTGTTTGGIVVRHPSFAAKPWITGTTASGVRVIGGDFR